MENQSKAKLNLELLWWALTAVVVFAVIFPLKSQVPGYGFTFQNTLFIVVFITVTRYLFLLQHTFLARIQWLKIALTFVCIPLIFKMVEYITGFQTFMDYMTDVEKRTYFGNKSLDAELQWETFLKTEMLLFGVGAVIAAVLFPFRMIISVWRQWNGRSIV